jgi:crossover junction endodeoxyribonuclease RusA
VIRFTVQGVARPKGSARAFMPKGARFPVVTSDNKNLKAWERDIKATLQQVMPAVPRAVRHAIWQAPIAITLTFHLPRPKSLPRRVVHHMKKPDLDKCVRGAIDALIGMVIQDDSQVVAIGASKLYADTGARLDVVVKAWDGPLFVDPSDGKELDGPASVLAQ